MGCIPTRLNVLSGTDPPVPKSYAVHTSFNRKTPKNIYLQNGIFAQQETGYV
jgi:hypothetical protein